MACTTALLPAGLLDLADLEQQRWAEISDRIRISGHPTCEGDPDPDPDPEPDPKDPAPDPDADPDPDKVKSDDDWRTKARKHENAAKRERKAREEAERKLREREDANKSEHEKALEQARKEARTEALTEAEKERRADRLEVAVTRLASRGVTVGEGDDAKSVRFADAEDALLNVERAISRGEIDTDDIYDSEGKINNEALTTALAELATAKPHLLDSAERPKPKGDPDTRKGEPAKSDLEGMTPEDHAKRKYGATK